MVRLLQSLIGSQGGRVPLASRGQRPRRRQAKPPREVRILRAEHGYSARRRAVTSRGSAAKIKEALKGCGGKQEFSPTSNIYNLVMTILRNSPVDCFGSTLHS